MFSEIIINNFIYNKEFFITNHSFIVSGIFITLLIFKFKKSFDINIKAVKNSFTNIINSTFLTRILLITFLLVLTKNLDNPAYAEYSTPDEPPQTPTPTTNPLKLYYNSLDEETQGFVDFALIAISVFAIVLFVGALQDGYDVDFVKLFYDKPKK